MKKAPHIVLGVTGSIAAYKAAELVRRMKALGWDVTVVMTEAATRFVGELTFQTLSRNKVGRDMFADSSDWEIEHLAFSEWADAMVIAPCTANVLAKLAHGLADDLLSCTALATRAPVVIAPAMNVNMWNHPATQANVRLLRQRGVRFVGPVSGDLACGVKGRGRMAEVDNILAGIQRLIKPSR